ncbi:MAG: YigZ family protein [Clostridia bacterium]|nr:YigZ family protein [Clostridia bacterium]
MSGDTEIFRTVAREAEAEIEEKRSVFISAVRRVATEEEALAFVKERKKLHADARHTVFAYVLRKGAARYSDDSEPTGTAGMPTLEAIRRTGLEDVVVATTRYFGGILLGAGGLTRTYGAAAHAGLAAAGVAEYVPFTYYLLDCSYADYQKIQVELPKLGAAELQTDFSDRVAVRVGLPSEGGEALCRRIEEMTAGRCLPREIEKGMDLKPEK